MLGASLPATTHRIIAFASLVVLAPLGSSLLRAAEPSLDSVRHERVSTPNSDKSIVHIPARDGIVATSDLFAGLGQIAGLDMGVIEWLLPEGELDLDKPQTAKRIARINRLMGRYGTIRIVHDADRDAMLVIEIDRGRLHMDKRRAQSKVRQVSLRVIDPRGKYRAQQRFGLMFDDTAEDRTDDPLIIGVHGFNGSASAIDAFLNPLRDAGFACGSFIYPNDQAIAESATLLAGELAGLARRQPNRRVALVTFSMGGLIARATIENPQLDPGNVEQLVMIAPPNRGSVCARFARGFDLYEHIAREKRFAPRGMLAASMLDGLGEARQDLCPDSHFLRQLNARKRNAAVRYSILLGEGGELSEEHVDRMVASIDKLEQKSTLARIFGPRLDRLRAEFGELSRKSDGFVTVARGRLDGVDDVETFSFRHIDRFDNLDDDRIRSLHAAIARRLE
jgi:pimeloyl-ACP methyl ester carboxylesterase